MSASAKTGGIIVLLGHKNDENGLSATARNRCTTASTIARERPDWLILPTGGFGETFNTTNRAHGLWLRDFLITLNIPPERVLPHTNSSHTLEDALYVRRVIGDLTLSKILVVTSQFHLPRTRLIFERVFPDFELEFLPSADAGDKEDQADEDNKIERLKAEWVDVPLYGGAWGRTEFPAEVYENATAEQKHYDNLSYFIISGTFLAFAFPYAIDLEQFGELAWLSFLFSSLLIVMLVLQYHRMSSYARTARRVLATIEAQHGQPGFSLNYRRIKRPRLLGRFDVPAFANLVAALLVLVQLLALVSLTGNAAGTTP